ncbi:MAG: glycoside hydrolase family 3 N-terminal domain-containing protein [Candidatus Nealsonbacteria bacterium]
MKHIKIVFFLFLLILIALFVVYKIPKTGKSKVFYFGSTEEEKEEKNKSGLSENEKLLDGLSLDQKIGQMFIIGFDGTEITPEIEKLVKEIHPGGILLLKRNVEDEAQLKKLISSLQEIALNDTGLALFIAVDQEGGLVSRVDWLYSVPQSEIRNKNEAYQIGKDRGEELKKLGINLNLTPLLDISEKNDFIYERAFHKDIETIKVLAENIIKGQKDAGIFTSIKHFPGYTGISFNPEEKLAIKETIPEISQFQDLEILPEMVMTSNVIYKEIDESLPFTLSKKGIQFLKEKIKGNYLIISDDLSQNSLLDEFTLNEIVSLPVKAGVDILIFSGWRIEAEKGFLALKKALENNQVSETQIDKSVLKIIGLKNVK